MDGRNFWDGGGKSGQGVEKDGSWKVEWICMVEVQT